MFLPVSYLWDGWWVIRSRVTPCVISVGRLGALRIRVNGKFVVGYHSNTSRLKILLRYYPDKCIFVLSLKVMNNLKS